MIGHAAPVFFGLVQWALLTDVVLTISRLLDRSRDSATLRFALKSAKHALDPPEGKVLENSLTSIESKAKDAGIVGARNWVIAHSKKGVAFKLDPPPRSEVESIQVVIAAISNWVQELHRVLDLGCPLNVHEAELHADMDALVVKLRARSPRRGRSR